jgi:glycosyltransferase involved in cell wall biosynthesis
MVTGGKQPSASHGGVLHWAGRVTDEVFSFLGPTSEALAQSGVEQTIVLSDEPRYRHLLPRFHQAVRLILTPHDANPYHRWRRAHSAFVKALGDSSPGSVHLHGFVPYVLSLRELRKMPADFLVYYSPHGSRALSSWALPSLLLRAALRAVPGNTELREIANTGTDLRRLETLSPKAVELVESQVSEAFYSVVRCEAQYPLIVTGNRVPSPESADLFSRLAVLLGDQQLRVSFRWIGGSNASSEALLRAANVGVLDETQDIQRSTMLAAAWVYVAPRGTDGFPLFLAEAMAAGVPCVAVDTPYHRDLIEHGSTGYLCRTDKELLECVAMLLDSPTERERVGAAASAQAERRFTGPQFRNSLFDAYSLVTFEEPIAEPTSKLRDPGRFGHIGLTRPAVARRRLLMDSRGSVIGEESQGLRSRA